MSKSTREDIIHAASKVLGERGYDATTLKEIARASGLAPGLVHYYFGGKEQLLVEVVQYAGDRFAQTQQQLRSSDAHGDIVDTLLNEAKRRVDREPAEFRLRYELYALGLRNAMLTPSVRTFLQSARQAIRNLASSVMGPTTVQPEALAAVILAAIDGLALQKLADPDFDIDASYEALARMVKAVGE